MTAEAHPIEKERVMAYLDGELSPESAARIAAHLAECPECRALEAELRAISSNMLEWRVEHSPAGLTQGMNAVLRAEQLGGGRRKNRRLGARPGIVRRMLFSRWVWATACAAIALMIVWKVAGPGGSQVNLFYDGSGDQKELARSSSSSDLSNNLENRPAAGGGGGYEARMLSNPSPAVAPGLLPPGDNSNETVSAGPLIARTASLNISVKDFEVAREGVDRIVHARGGYAASMTINSQKDEPQSLDAELRIPANVCDAALADLKGLGRVEQEQQGGEDVASQVVDLDARLKNARLTETRLEDILRTRTGKVEDVLDVEKEMAGVREEIERMEGEQKQMNNRVAFASIQLELHEEYAASLDVGSPSIGRRVRNAMVDGFHAAADGVISVALFLLYVAPSLLLVGLALFWPVRWAWRRQRRV